MSTALPVSLEVLVEEQSAAEALRILLPRIGPGVDYKIASFQGERDLLQRLPHRLRGFATYAAAANVRIVVLLDRDADDCRGLKAELEQMAADVGLATPSADRRAPVVLFRIAVLELEAWFLGDPPALHRAYPRLPVDLATRAKYRDPEAISGGTWEALEHLLKKHGYHRKGLAKTAAARDIAAHMNVESNRSKSFRIFRDGLRRLVSEETHAQAD